MVSTPRSTTLRSSGQGWAGILGVVAGCRELRLEVEGDGPLLQAQRQLVHEEIRCPLGRIGRREMDQMLRHDHVAHGLPLAGLVDEDEGVEAVVLLVGEAVRRRDGGQGAPESGDGWR